MISPGNMLRSPRVNASWFRGSVLDDNGRPVPQALIEIWQANSAGRYAHVKDQHPAPLDPNFTGRGRILTDENGILSFRNH